MHLDSETALDLVDGTMNDSECRFWYEHVDSCSQCALAIREWSSLAGWVKRAHLVSAPEHVLTSAKKIFATHHERWEFRPFLRQIVAFVVYDSSTQPALAGARADLAVNEQMFFRQVFLRAEEFDIRVRISKVEDHRELLGQILPRDTGRFIRDADVHLQCEEERIGKVKLNDLGEFQFNDIPDGLLSLQIDLPHVTVISSLRTTV